MKELSVTNMWESMIWSIDGVKGPAPTHIKTVFIQGKEYRIEWRKMTTPYDDMGHTYTATSTHGFIQGDDAIKSEVNAYDIIHKQRKKIWVK